jgi:hypothetical protein
MEGDTVMVRLSDKRMAHFNLMNSRGNITDEDIERCRAAYLKQVTEPLAAKNPGREFEILLGQFKVTKYEDGTLQGNASDVIAVWLDGKGPLL